MGAKRHRDYQTLNIFVILGILTMMLVLGMRLVLFAPSAKPPALSSPISEEAAQK